MNRLQRPWEALRLPLAISRQTQDTLISKTDMGLVGEILLTRLDDLQKAIMATRHPMFEAEKLVEQVQSFAELSSAVVKEIEVRRDGRFLYYSPNFEHMNNLLKFLTDNCCSLANLDCGTACAVTTPEAAQPKRKHA